MGDVWKIVDMISAANRQTTCKRLANIVKAHNAKN